MRHEIPKPVGDAGCDLLGLDHDPQLGVQAQRPGVEVERPNEDALAVHDKDLGMKLVARKRRRAFDALAQKIGVRLLAHGIRGVFIKINPGPQKRPAAMGVARVNDADVGAGDGIGQDLHRHACARDAPKHTNPGARWNQIG